MAVVQVGAKYDPILVGEEATLASMMLSAIPIHSVIASTTRVERKAVNQNHVLASFVFSPDDCE